MADPLFEIALDLCANLAAEDRYRRLAAAVRKMVPCDSTALLRLVDGDLVLVVIDGLLPDTAGGARCRPNIRAWRASWRPAGHCASGTARCPIRLTVC